MPTNEVMITPPEPGAPTPPKKRRAATVASATDEASAEYAAGVENGFVVLSQGCTVTDPLTGQSFPKGHGDVFDSTLLTEERAKKLLFKRAIRPAFEEEAGLTHVDLPDTVGTARASAEAMSLQAMLTDKDAEVQRYAARVAELEREKSALATELRNLKQALAEAKK